MPKRIYIGNLSFNTTEESLKKCFEQFGEVSSVIIIKNNETGISKGFGFVEMPSDEQAFNAIASLNGKDFEGRKIRVHVAEDRSRSEGLAFKYKSSTKNNNFS